jgi:competence protein ComER
VGREAPVNVGFIGMGNMGQMLVTALARTGYLQPGEMFASNRGQEKLKRITANVPGLQVVYSNSELAKRCAVIFLCVKPNETKDVLADIRPYITSDQMIVTITNTLEIPQLEAVVKAKVAKVIPSLVHAIHVGVSLLMFGERCSLEDKARLIALLGAISRPVVIEEAEARVASDLTSCGPAFVSYVFRAMATAARRYQPSLSQESVDGMIRDTALATCLLMEPRGLTFDDVIAKVSTPGGVTADGINVLDELMAGVWEQVIETTILKEASKKAKVEL